MNRAKWKLSGRIPIAQHAWIYFLSNVYSEFSVSKVCLLYSYSITAFHLLWRHCDILPSPTFTTSWLTFHWLLLHLQVRWPNLYALAHSVHSTWKIPHLMMSFRHLLSTSLNKPYQSSHWKITLLTRMGIVPSCMLPFIPSSSQPQLISCFTNGW